MRNFLKGKPLLIVKVMALMSAFTVFVSQAWSANLYRYVDDGGKTVISHTLPSEAIYVGYEVLAPSGTVLEVVPRQLTEDEIANMSDSEKRKRVEAAEAEKQLLYDESLLRRYSTVNDIESARDRAIKEQELSLAILKSNIISLQKKIDRERKKAANIERNGRKVPESLVNNLVTSEKELEITQERIVQRRSDIGVTKQAFQADIDRFKYITEVLNYRRR